MHCSMLGICSASLGGQRRKDSDPRWHFPEPKPSRRLQSPIWASASTLWAWRWKAWVTALSSSFRKRRRLSSTRFAATAASCRGNPALNVAAVSARALLDHVGEARGLKIRLFKGLPLASGLGSSAASAVVSVVALNKLLGEPFAREELLPFCLKGEALVSGYHADNLAPCLLGGIVLVAGTTVDAIQPLPIPEPFHLALVTPDIPVPTDSARKDLAQACYAADHDTPDRRRRQAGGRIASRRPVGSGRGCRE